MAGKRRSAAAIFCTVGGRPGRVCSKCRTAQLLAQFRLRSDGVRCAACRACENEVNRRAQRARAAQLGTWRPNYVYKRGPHRRRAPAAALTLAAALGYPTKPSAA